MTVCVVGIDGVSLALAAHYALRGLPTVATDLDPELMRRLTAGDLPWSDPDLDWGFAHTRKQDSLQLQPSVEDAVRDRHVVVIFTGIDVADGALRYERLDETVRRVGSGMSKGTLVVVESLVAVGDTRDRIGRALADASGLVMGEEFMLAHSPQQCSVGHVVTDLSRCPRIFGAVGDGSLARATEFYSRVADSKLGPVRNCETAEFSKLMQLVTRGASTAMAGEWSALCVERDIDLREAITVAASQSLFPIVEPRADVPPEVRLAFRLLSESGSTRLPIVESARRGLDDAFARSLQRLSDRLDGLAGKNVLVLQPLTAAIPDHVSVALLAAGARVSTRVEPPVDAIVYLYGAPLVGSVPPAVLDACVVLLDCTGTLSRVRVERLGVDYLSAY